MATFIDLCLNGVANFDDVDNFIEEWHTIGSTVSLPEYLGMTNIEYAQFVKDPDFIHSIIKNRKFKNF